jgi:hypothetical protein
VEGRADSFGPVLEENGKMNIKLLGIVATVSGLAMVACGDDTGSGGAGGTGGDTSSSTGTKASTTGTGTATTGTGTASSTSSGMAAPCAMVCMGDPGCMMDPADPGMECGDCVQMQADMFAACAVAILTDPACQDVQDCADYVDCVVGMGTTCETDFPAGYALAAAITLFNCGACGDGTP